MSAPVSLSPVARQLFLNPSNGVPASGFKLFTYLAGTTTKQITYKDSTGATPNTNPIILDTLGECDLWLQVGSAYKLVFAYPTDGDPPTNPIWTRDNILANPTAIAGQNAFLQSNYLSAGSPELALLVADTAAAAVGGTVIVDLTTTTLTADRVLTAPQIEVALGSSIVTGPFDLTGNIFGYRGQQLFDADGSGLITLSASPAYAAWWGCRTNDPTIDTPALLRAAASMRLINGEVILPPTLATNETIPGAVYGITGCASFSGNTEYGTVWSTTLLGTTPAIAYQADNFSYLGMGVKNVSFSPTNAGSFGSRNSGTAILLSGVQLMCFENVEASAMTKYVWGYNEIARQFTEQHQFTNCYANLCDTTVHLQKGAGDGSFRGWRGFITMGVYTGQTGLLVDTAAFFYNTELTFQGTGFGPGNVTMVNIVGDVGGGKIDYLLENQTTPPATYTLVGNLAGGRAYETLSYLNIQGGLPYMTGTLGLIPGFNLSTGLGKVGSTRGTGIASMASFALPPSNGGTFSVRNSTSGGTAFLLCDQVSGITIISDPSSFISLTDTGSNVWYVAYVGNIITLKNRYAGDETADVIWNFAS